MAGAARKSQHGIVAPRLPKLLEAGAIAAGGLRDGDTIEQVELAGVALAAQVAYRLHFAEVAFTTANLTETRFEHIRLEDVRFSGCNMANAAWPQLSCLRAEFSGCRMTGFVTQKATFNDTIFRECKGDLSQFYEAKMRAVRFEDCLLAGADFRNADLTGVVFARCDLTNADFTGATLEGADLRGCPIEGMRAGAKEMKGARIDEIQALALVRAMGIIIN